ncbi:MAG: agmatine/peptidylarginine deiminase [Paracoccaceae bacterium]
MQRREFLATQAQLGAFCLFGGSAMAASDFTFAVPPEEAAHEATFMQWPVSPRVHPDQVFLETLQHTIADIANAIAEFEPVIMLASAADQPGARKKLSDAITLWDIPTEDLWCRDSGPLIAVASSGQRVVSHIRFNGWGNRQVHKRDGSIATEVAWRLGFDVIPSGLVGEAGGVEQDGHGLLMAHESSWVNDNRNPELSRDQIEQRLLDAYGAERMIWADGVWGEDITDYHIDSLARFTGPGRVLINLPDDPDPDDLFHMAALDTHDHLVAEGLSVDVIPEPEFRRVKNLDFVASYANYYVCNGAVIAARFGDRETDRIAREALQRHYPTREIVTLNVDALGEIGGGIHCATQQLPAA